MRSSLVLSIILPVCRLVNGRVDLSLRDTRSTPLLTNFPGQPPLPTIDQTRNTFAPTTNFSDVQGDVFVGMRKPKETFIFFSINNPKAFKRALRSTIPSITSTAQLLGPVTRQPLAFVNIAFSSTGLKSLNITDDLGDPHFAKGQFADAPSLGDLTSLWEPTFTNANRLHGVFLVGSDQQRRVDFVIRQLKESFGKAITEVTRVEGSARPGSQAGHEHFGFLDGISNPIIQSFSSARLPGQGLVPDGTILAGRSGDFVTSRPPWALDGSFLVFRKLKQLVPEFNTYTRNLALSHAYDSVTNKTVRLTPKQGANLFAARMVGRWKSGAPLDLAPCADDPALGADPARNNNFDYSHSPGMDLKSDQSRCPFSAHIRKTRPRADLAFGGGENTASQAIRAGIPYGDEVTEREQKLGVTKRERGLAFVEYQSSIANGFITQQVTWANNAFFPFKSTSPGLDPIVGQTGTTVPRLVQGLNPMNATQAHSILPFVIPVGGEYFFSPSISALKKVFLA